MVSYFADEELGTMYQRADGAKVLFSGDGDPGQAFEFELAAVQVHL